MRFWGSFVYAFLPTTAKSESPLGGNFAVVGCFFPTFSVWGALFDKKRPRGPEKDVYLDPQSFQNDPSKARNAPPDADTT